MANLSKDTAVDEVIRKFNLFIKEEGLTQAAAAGKMNNMNKGKLSAFLLGKYTGDVGAVKHSIVEFLNRQQKKKEIKRLRFPFLLTKHAKEILAVCNITWSNGGIGLVYGRAGLGKTTALKHYAEQNENVVYLVCQTPMAPVDFLNDLCDELNIPAEGTDGKKTRAVIKELKNTDTFIIIDEIQKAGLKVLETIRGVHDKAECPVVLAGANEIYRRMTGKKADDYDQLFSRIKFQQSLKEKIEDEDLTALIDAAGIGHSAGIVSFLSKSANNYGYYRTLHTISQLAGQLAVAAGKSVDLTLIKQAASKTVLAAKHR